MGPPEAAAPPSSSEDVDALISELCEKHRIDLENLTLTTKPFKTLQLFIFATMQYLKRSLLYVLEKGGWFMFLCFLVMALGLLLVTVDGPHEKHVQELLRYSRFVLWWVALGVASSVGLGSGLHTFVLYLGPHIALFTIKAVKCGRVDLKTAPYDTMQLKRGPSWLDKDCSEFGTPLYPSIPESLVTVPISSLLPKVQLEAILWGLGTALGELPPYFISKAARLSRRKLDAMEELGAVSSKEDGSVCGFFKQIKRWLLSQLQNLNFLTILILASVPNPLFDLAGIMCGQFGIPFWKFFLATLIGKALIKAHMQAVFVISVCNNQLLEWVENELIWILSFVPGFSSMLPGIITKLHDVQEKYLSTPALTVSDVSDGKWNVSFASIWNTVIWLMLVNFFAKIVTDTAQRYLKKQQDLEFASRLSLEPKQSNPKPDCMPVSM